jgi:hypothetical protein
MDPNAALRDLKDALDDLSANASYEDARFKAIDRLDALAGWLERGGFPPSLKLYFEEDLR